MTRNRALLLGIAATLLGTFIWHGPGGAGERLAKRIDRDTRTMLVANEAPPVVASVQRGPLMRRVIFKGEGDTFQRTEMVRLTETIPGVAEARWNRPGFRFFPLPMLVEAMLLALLGFAAGAIISYVAALRARSNLV